MPGSSSKGKLTISKWFQQIPNKKTILDVGPGWATYSKMLRKPKQVWHAVEIHEPYIKRFQLKKYYDKVFIVDVRKFEPEITYDVIILGDVIEHMHNKHSIKVLEKLFKKSRLCIVSLPLDDETHACSENCSDYWHNEHEEHKGAWSNKLFLKTILDLGGEILAMEKYQELGIYLIATTANNNYITEPITNPLEWFLFHYTNWYENREEGIINKYKRKIRNKIMRVCYKVDT